MADRHPSSSQPSSAITASGQPGPSQIEIVEKLFTPAELRYLRHDLETIGYYPSGEDQLLILPTHLQPRSSVLINPLSRPGQFLTLTLDERNKVQEQIGREADAFAKTQFLLGCHGITSTLSDTDLIDLKTRYHLEDDTTYHCFVHGPDMYAHSPPTGYTAVYKWQLQRGLSFPIIPALSELCRVYNIGLSQLDPSAIRNFLALLVWCRLAKMPFSMKFFRTFFLIKSHNGNFKYITKRYGEKFDGFKPFEPTTNTNTRWKNEWICVKHCSSQHRLGLWRTSSTDNSFNIHPGLDKAEYIQVLRKCIEEGICIEGTGDIPFDILDLADLATVRPDPYMELDDNSTHRLSELVNLMSRFEKAKRGKKRSAATREAGGTSSTPISQYFDSERTVSVNQPSADDVTIDANADVVDVQSDEGMDILPLRHLKTSTLSADQTGKKAALEDFDGSSFHDFETFKKKLWNGLRQGSSELSALNNENQKLHAANAALEKQLKALQLSSSQKDSIISQQRSEIETHIGYIEDVKRQLEAKNAELADKSGEMERHL